MHVSPQRLPIVLGTTVRAVALALAHHVTVSGEGLWIQATRGLDTLSIYATCEDDVVTLRACAAEVPLLAASAILGFLDQRQHAGIRLQTVLQDTTVAIETVWSIRVRGPEALKADLLHFEHETHRVRARIAAGQVGAIAQYLDETTLRRTEGQA